MCTGLIQTQHTCRASHWDQKCHRWALEGLGPSSGPKLQNLDSFTGAAPWHIGFNDIHRLLWPRQAFGTWVFKKTCTWIVCDVPLLRSSPSGGEVLHENQSNVHFDPRLLCSWVVMNIINGVARGSSPCALALPSLASEEQTLERNTCKCHVLKCTEMCIVGERIWGLT